MPKTSLKAVPQPWASTQPWNISPQTTQVFELQNADDRGTVFRRLHWIVSAGQCLCTDIKSWSPGWIMDIVIWISRSVSSWKKFGALWPQLFVQFQSGAVKALEQQWLWKAWRSIAVAASLFKTLLVPFLRDWRQSMSIKMTLVITDMVMIHLHNYGITLCRIILRQFLDVTILLPVVNYSVKLGLALGYFYTHNFYIIISLFELHYLYFWVHNQNCITLY